METLYVPQLSSVIDAINPWDLTSKEEIDHAEAEGNESQFAMEIGRRNQDAIDSADIVIAALDGQEIDSGTAAEVGYAFGKGKLIFGYRSDLRESGEKGSILNLQVEYFIKASGGEMLADLGELITTLRRRLRSHPRSS